MTTPENILQAKIYELLKERTYGAPISIENVKSHLHAVLNEIFTPPPLQVGLDVDLDKQTGTVNIAINLQLGKPDKTL